MNVSKTSKYDESQPHLYLVSTWSPHLGEWNRIILSVMTLVVVIIIIVPYFEGTTSWYLGLGAQWVSKNKSIIQTLENSYHSNLICIFFVGV